MVKRKRTTREKRQRRLLIVGIGLLIAIACCVLATVGSAMISTIDPTVTPVWPTTVVQTVPVESTPTPAKGYSPVVSTFTPQPVATAAPEPTPFPQPVCDCSHDRHNRKDFSTHRAAQACYEYCLDQGAGDIHRLDGDSDGVACESLLY